MLVKDYDKFLRLSKVLNSTFGTEGAENRPTSVQSIKFNLLDDGLIKVIYIMVVNFGSDSMMREQMVRYTDEALGMLEAAVKTLKEKHKAMFPDAPVPVFNIQQNTIGTDVEFLTFSMFRGTRKAYFRFGCLVEVE